MANHETTAEQPGAFLENLIQFARLLRELGFDVPPDRVSDLGRILTRTGVARRDDVYNASRALFVRRHSEYPLFDRAFQLFFSARERSQQAVIDPTQAPKMRRWRPKTIQQLAEEARTGQEPPGEQPTPPTEEMPLYSPTEILRTTRFDQLSDEQTRQARQLIAQMDWQMGTYRTRRYKRIPRGARLDLARVLRRNLKHGADPYELPARERKNKPRPLVVLADISGSMERYSKMVLQLVHALSSGARAPVEVFVFGTRLTRITTDLRRKSVDAALARVSAHVPDWAGGTRIGDSLKAFNFAWARRVLRHGAVVLIISDGWDRGELELLRDEMARLQRSCGRLLWLNPLLGADAQTYAQGLQVALPFVDQHLPIHNLASIEQLVGVLETIGSAHPLRRQRPLVELPREEKQEVRPMELPQMGTSDYVRRTMVMRVENGAPSFRYEENPDA